MPLSCAAEVFVSRHRFAGMSVSCSLLLAPFGLAQDVAVPEPDALVVQLEDPQLRTAAYGRLVALGAAGVPAITAKLESAGDALREDLLTILTAIGPDAAAAVPLLIQLAEAGRVHGATFVATLAELIPWRAADVELDLTAMRKGTIKARVRARGAPLDDSIGYSVAYQRLLLRAKFERTPDLDTLLAIVQHSHAARVELAIEHLGRRGAAATDALPALRTILERPEPRMLVVGGTVPLHRKAARAVLAIAPQSQLAVLAADVLSGRRPAQVATPLHVPERVKGRIDVLLRELEVPAERERAAANLVALGEAAAEPVGGLLSGPGDVRTITAALGVLRALGPRGGRAVPQLSSALTELSTEHTLAVLEALTATVCGSADVLPYTMASGSIVECRAFGVVLRGPVDEAFLTDYFHATRVLEARLAVDPRCGVAELAACLEHGSVRVREFALAALAAKGESARPLLPVLGAMLEATQPRETLAVWLQNSVTTREIDRTPFVRRRAAEAIVAVATADDPLLAAARAILAEPEPQ